VIGNRAQVGGGLNILPFVVIALVVMAIVLSVGMDIASNFAQGINDSAFEQAAEDTTTPDSYYGPPLVPIPVVVVMAFLVGGVVSVVKRTDSEPEQPDEITVIQNKYVDGDIRTTTKLEAELEQEVEPYLDDSDVQELDDLLNGDDTE